MTNLQSLQSMDFLNNPLYAVLFLLLIVWIVAWKGVALWKSARNGQKKWFIACLILNTLGILEIVYLFYFQKKNAQNTSTNPQ